MSQADPVPGQSGSAQSPNLSSHPVPMVLLPHHPHMAPPGAFLGCAPFPLAEAPRSTVPVGPGSFWPGSTRAAAPWGRKQSGCGENSAPRCPAPLEVAHVKARRKQGGLPWSLLLGLTQPCPGALRTHRCCPGSRAPAVPAAGAGTAPLFAAVVPFPGVSPFGDGLVIMVHLS